MPVLINRVAIGLMFTFIFFPRIGPVPVILNQLNLAENVNLLGNVNTAMWTVAFAHVWCGVGLQMILLSSGMAALPTDIYEAAEIDGANKWRTYFTIYLPNSKAILATLGLLKAVSVWNDYMWPLIMTNSESMRTVQLALTMFKTDTGIMWNQMMAGSVLVALPMFALFLCAQKYFIQGIVTSGLK